MSGGKPKQTQAESLVTQCAWFETGRVTHPLQEITIAGNLAQMPKDKGTVGSDVVFRSSSDAPTVRIRGLTASGS